MLTIFSVILALVVGFAAAACILAPELADHEACKPLEGCNSDASDGSDDRRHIDVTA